MTALFLTSIRSQGNTFMQQIDESLKPHAEYNQLISLAQYWVDSCILLVDPAILACRDVPLLQPFGLFISIEYSRRFQTDAYNLSKKLSEPDCTFDCKVLYVSELLTAFARPPIRF